MVVATLNVALIGVSAATRPLWHDELYTLTVLRQGIGGGLWSALATGVDQTPPGYFVVERASTALLGDTLFALRFPSIIGYALLCGTMFVYLRRHAGPICAAAAAFLPLTTATIYYAQEARPYALVLGLAGLAHLLWASGTASPARRRPAIAALAIVGLLAGSIHYTAVLIALPPAVGEAVRSFRRRRIDPLVWGAIGTVTIPLLLCLPLIRASSEATRNFWAIATWQQVPLYLFWLLGRKGLLVWSMLGVGYALFTLVRRRAERRPVARSFSHSLPEITSVATFLILPIVAVVFALATSRGFTERYAISGLVGYVILAAWSLARLQTLWPRLPAVMLILCLGFSIAGSASLVRGSRTAHRDEDRLFTLLNEVVEPNIPVAISHNVLFVQLTHATTGRVRESLVYPADPMLSLRHLGHDSVELGTIEIAKLGGLPVLPFSDFLAENCGFLILHSNPDHGWLLAELNHRQAPVNVVARQDGYVVSRVDRCADS